MSDTATIAPRRRPFEEAPAEPRRLPAEIAAANPDRTHEDRDAIAAEWTVDVNRGSANHVRRSRGAPDVPRPRCAS